MISFGERRKSRPRTSAREGADRRAAQGGMSQGGVTRAEGGGRQAMEIRRKDVGGRRAVRCGAVVANTKKAGRRRERRWEVGVNLATGARARLGWDGVVDGSSLEGDEHEHLSNGCAAEGHPST